MIYRRLVSKRTVWYLRDDRAMLAHAQETVVRDSTDGYGIQTPFVEDFEYFFFFALVCHKKHALLRFAQHDLIGRHVGFTLRNPIEIQFDARSGTRTHLATRTCQARGSHVLNADNEPSMHRLNAGFE